ncbi:hypothetical protein GKIL_4130 [Gloeobacter kilaueensis JS1]|uniref:PIN domain-containing protein n=1 Tax=Gloeobacter kilaueensis (strain ATCC BAA-2537 / CCAP 1431/1 / ULC 316 / JS1) TaxID=1183438 RepID=U5QN84_GLOK1|nr:hypothetical protein GKIL_4130 [Gloeobacter kilaueensis JS1]
MRCTLYIETNFLMSIATGRDSASKELLGEIPTDLKVAIPSVCCMESLSAFEDEKKRSNKFRGTLDNQIAQLSRDLSSK